MRLPAARRSFSGMCRSLRATLALATLPLLASAPMSRIARPGPGPSARAPHGRGVSCALSRHHSAVRPAARPGKRRAGHLPTRRWRLSPPRCRLTRNRGSGWRPRQTGWCRIVTRHNRSRAGIRSPSTPMGLPVCLGKQVGCEPAIWSTPAHQPPGRRRYARRSGRHGVVVQARPRDRTVRRRRIPANARN